MDDLRILVTQLKPLVVALTETWLSDEITNDLINIDDYFIYRKDRLINKGGGTALFISKNIISSKIELPTDCPDKLDIIWINFNNSVAIGNCYIPPNLNSETNNAIIQYLSVCMDFIDTTLNLPIILTGDFNRISTSAFIHHNITNIVSSPTRQDAILDLLFIDNRLLNHLTYKLNTLPPIGNSDHNCLFFDSQWFHTPIIQKIKFYDYRLSYLSGFYNAIKHINWNLLYLCHGDTNEKLKIFYDLIEPAVNVIPISEIIMTNKDKPWINPLCKMLIQKRWDAFRAKNFVLYNYYKEKARIAINKAKSEWSNNCRNNKNIWKLVRPIRGNNKTKCTHPQHSASQINENLKSIFTRTDTNFTNLITDNDIVWNINFTPYSVENSILQSKSKGIGTDKLPLKLLKVGADILSSPICHIFNCSIQEGIFPDIWKISKITPLPKCSNPGLNDYRPISNLSTISKIMEKEIFKSLKHTFFQNYGNTQYGFKEGSNTNCALLSLLDDLSLTLDKKETTGVSIIGLDATKAFDKVSHNIIIKTLIDSNFPSTFTEWFKSYLNNRYQYVEFNEQRSDNCLVLSGVPQGAVLSPPIFCLIMKSLKCSIPGNKIYKFADDVVVLIAHTSDINDEFSCTTEINNILQWFNDNGIKINNNKSQYLFIKKGNNNINYQCFSNFKNVEHIKILGIYLSNNLSFSHHILYLIKKVSSRFYLFKHFKYFFSKDKLLLLFNSLIFSLFLYCSEVFISLLSIQDINLINKSIKRFHNLICGNPCNNTNCYLNDICKNLRSRSFNKFCKILKNSNHILYHRCPSFLRSGRRLEIIHTYSAFRFNTFFLYNARLYNSN